MQLIHYWKRNLKRKDKVESVAIFRKKQSRLYFVSMRVLIKKERQDEFLSDDQCFEPRLSVRKEEVSRHKWKPKATK